MKDRLDLPLRGKSLLSIFEEEVGMFSDHEVILLGESYENDEFFFIRTLKQAEVPCSVRIMRTGSEVLHYLQGRGRYADREEYPLPSLIFLELYLPVISGFELLHWIHAEEHLRTIPLFMFVDEINAMACDNAKALGAVGCITKPFKVEHVQMLKEQLQHA